jgi:hypothetical protein
LHPQRQQHPVGLAAEAVVLVVGIVEAIEQRPAAERGAEAPVDVDVVHEGVRPAVRRDADPDRHQVAGPRPVEAHEQPDPDQPRERQGEQVVGLVAVVRGAMVTAVEPHPEAVHDPPVDGVGHRFHQHEGRHGQGHARHHPRTVRRARPPGTTGRTLRASARRPRPGRSPC